MFSLQEFTYTTMTKKVAKNLLRGILIYNLHQTRAFTNLQVHLGLILSERGNAGKERLALHPGLGQYEQQRAN